MADDQYKRSVTRALRANNLLLPFAPALLALPDYAAAMLACDVVALTGARVEHGVMQNSAMVFATTMALQGYNSDMALHICNTLYNTTPGFSPNSCMLMSKQQLIEEFGLPVGQVLADALADPDRQPVLHAMLFRDRGFGVSLVQRRTEEVVFKAPFTMSNSNEAPFTARLPWEVRERKLLPAGDAQYVFHQVTEGGVLEALSVVPVLTGEPTQWPE